MSLNFSDIIQNINHFKRPGNQTGGSDQNKRLKYDRIIEIADVKNIGMHKSSKFHREERRLLVRLKHNMVDFANVFKAEVQVNQDIRQIVSLLTSDVTDNDFVTFYINHRELNQSLFIRPCRKKNFNSQSFLDAIATVSQSNKSFLIDGQLEMTIGIVSDIIGGGKRSNKLQTEDELLKAKMSVIYIKDDGDNSCFWRALAIGMFESNNKNLTSSKRQTYRRGLEHKVDAAKLAADCKLHYSDAVNSSQFGNISATLEINLVVVHNGESKRRIYPKLGKDIDNSKKTIILVYTENGESKIGHFHVIKSIRGYMSSQSSSVTDFCLHCWSIIKDLNIHRCDNTCKACHRTNSTCNPRERNICDGCEQTLFDQDCLAYHKTKLCGKFKLCDICEGSSKKTEKHNCLDRKCGKCYQKSNPLVDGLHQCYIAPKSMKRLEEEDKQLKLHVAFDIESMFITERNSKMQRHIAVLLVSMTLCDSCISKGSRPEVCPNKVCDRNPRIFRGDQLTNKSGCVTDFGNYIYNDLSKKAAEKNAFVKVYAHNFSGYDGQFILEDFFTRGFKDPTTIQTGTKILNMKIDNVSFIDSLKIFNQPLSKLPSSFGLTCKKGMFPYDANIPENRNKCISFPTPEMFGYQTMKPEDQPKFMEWYNSQDKTKLYDLEKEMLDYCIDDVKILIESIGAYRDQFKTITGLDPTSRHFTLASIGMETFRATSLKDGKLLGRTPTSGYAPAKVSMVGEAWLDAMEDELNCTIEREFPLGRYEADGFCLEKKLIFEYQGCRWHGCKCQFKDENEIVSERDGKTVKQVREYDHKKLKFYKKMLSEYQVVIAKDCDNQQKEKTEEHLKRIKSKVKRLEKLGLPRDLDLRQSLKGGRTNNLKFFFKTDGQSELKYFDFTSLYPSVVKQEKYPMGHPRRLTRNFDNSLHSYFGFVYCSVDAPIDLYLPVLGDTFDGKFVYSLCRTCTNEKNQNECGHTAEDRRLFGVWTTAELEVALKFGYKINEIFEVLHYEETSDQLFKEYIKMWQREKQEAEGTQGRVGQELDDHIENYYQREGIRLRKEKMVKNPGRRYIAKLMLNSFWGKFAQRPNLTQSKLVTNHEELVRMYDDPEIVIKGKRRVNDDTFYINFEYKDACKASAGVQNVAVASFVTSYARLRLYNVMTEQHSKYPGSIYYFDTDSIVFEARPGDDIPPLGVFFGDLTDELDGWTCIEGTFNGPKCYSLKLRNGQQEKVILKIKGLTLTSVALKDIDHEKMMKLSENYINHETNNEKVDVRQKQFIIDPSNQHIYTKAFFKQYKVTSEKRRIVPNTNDTVPYGFRNNQ